MITVIDGEDTAASRIRLVELTDKNSDIVRLDGKKNSIEDVENALSTGTLFTSKKTIIIESYLKLKPLPKLFELIKPYISDTEVNILLWDITVSKSKNVGERGIIHYTSDFPKLFYNFLDSLVPKRTKQNVELMRSVLKTNSPEQLFFSLIKRARYLMYIKTGDYQEFGELSKMAPWQIGKLQKQAEQWDEGGLRKFIMELAKTDEKIKTSTLSLPLAKHLDILILSAVN